ncbi:hypothetical protein FA95DRAFT_1601789 [Auriscalpium vulgare]|uniref:Uncharacterized protein n=1 Tax=Auriscalpium vulgare TaxID=40419 RepID=A0ACB8S7B9_9AGAM|nr:hypothetical protein FA95DRAFT_1601789 [Auriscalpium vulgare]
MTNFQDPAVVQADFLAFVKFLHCVDGIYIWEYFTTLDYEWSVLTGKRPYRWTIWIYSITRLSTLIGIILNLVGFNLESEIDCQAWIINELIFAYIAFASASVLIVLRIAAIWNRNKIALGLAAAAWLTNVAFLIHGVATAKSVWVPASKACAVLNTHESKANIAVTLGTDIALLLVMLAGLLRARKASKFGIWQLLYKQGLLWLLLASISEVPPTVFISLNLNDPWNLMFQTPSLIVMSIGATRIYRALTDFSSGQIADSSRGGNNISTHGGTTAPMRFMRTGAADTAVIPMSRLEVSVHTAYENYDDAERKEKPRLVNDFDAEMGPRHQIGQSYGS